MAAGRDIWVVAESDGERLREVTLEALSDARELADGGQVSVVACGGLSPAMEAQLARHGADRLLVSRGAPEAARSAERWAAVLGAALEREAPWLILFGATALGREAACRVAAARRLNLANDCNWVRPAAGGGVEAARAVYGGMAYARVRLRSVPALASLRPGAAGVGKPAPRQPQRVDLPPLERFPTRVASAGFVPADPRTVDIAEADRIVAVGRGIGGQANLGRYEELADRLGASLAASRPVVDAGWLPYERQVGQTGRMVAPRLYLAAGISGASHHTLGMKGSECVIAINRDRNAEIFKLADLKVLADLDEVIPALLHALERRPEA